MPFALPTLFRLLLLAALALHVAWQYTVGVRMASDTLEALGLVRVVAAAYALVMLLPLWWAFAITDLPEIYFRHWRARRRWRAHRCPACGYALDESASANCSECGAALREPAEYQITPRTILRYVWMNALAWALGVVAGEVWLWDAAR